MLHCLEEAYKKNFACFTFLSLFFYLKKGQPYLESPYIMLYRYMYVLQDGVPYLTFQVCDGVPFFGLLVREGVVKWGKIVSKFSAYLNQVVLKCVKINSRCIVEKILKQKNILCTSSKQQKMLIFGL